MILRNYPDFCMMSFSEEIVRWYEAHKRDLPWRQTQDAYVIWLSEVILQQTRVAQGLPYFERFVAHYPDVHAFAAASEGDILRHWQGLGYYSRARNMHKAAQMVKDMNTISYNIRRILPSDIASQALLPLVIDRYR